MDPVQHFTTNLVEIRRCGDQAGVGKVLFHGESMPASAAISYATPERIIAIDHAWIFTLTNVANHPRSWRVGTFRYLLGHEIDVAHAALRVTIFVFGDGVSRPRRKSVFSSSFRSVPNI
jgi:hypothetical protein